MGNKIFPSQKGSAYTIQISNSSMLNHYSNKCYTKLDLKIDLDTEDFQESVRIQNIKPCIAIEKLVLHQNKTIIRRMKFESVVEETEEKF